MASKDYLKIVFFIENGFSIAVSVGLFYKSIENYIQVKNFDTWFGFGIDKETKNLTYDSVCTEIGGCGTNLVVDLML